MQVSYDKTSKKLTIVVDCTKATKEIKTKQGKTMLLIDEVGSNFGMERVAQEPRLKLRCGVVFDADVRQEAKATASIPVAL